MNEIVLKAETELIDKDCREWLSKLSSQVQVINERTKLHTIMIRDLENLKK